jgi:hypothetical protein
MSQARPILLRIRAKKPQRNFRKSSTIAALYSSGYQYQHGNIDRPGRMIVCIA